MFQRSIELYKCRYTRILCDGDAKAVTSLNNANIYTEPIVKEDCVNHVSKRLYNGIERLKQSSKGSKHHLSGKGRITQKLQKQLSISYSQALKDAAPDVQDMQRAVFGNTLPSIECPLTHIHNINTVLKERDLGVSIRWRPAKEFWTRIGSTSIRCQSNQNMVSSWCHCTIDCHLQVC